MGIFDLHSQMVFYGAYHSNPVNQMIHIIFVPTIMWSALVWIAPYPSPTSYLTVGPYLTTIPLNYAMLAVSLYAAYYLFLEPLATLLYAPVLFGIALSATAFAGKFEAAPWISLGVHVVSWLAQFWGHAAHEKRSPALLDNLFQAFALAPLFVWLEVLFTLGYGKAFHRRVEEAVASEVAKFRETEKLGRAGKSQ